ncbi:MAG: hypothetical protein GY950_00130 [bacterium]|nr:hypothetical protein [bacterium]
MKQKLFIFVVLFAAAAVLFPALPGGENGKTVDIEKNIKAGAKYLLDKQPDPGKECQDGLHFLVEAIYQAFPHTGYSKDLYKKITTARQLFNKNSVFDKEAVQILHHVYASINAGKKFQMPEISSMNDAVAYGRNLLKTAREKIKDKNYKIAVKSLLETILMVVTPVKR